MGVIRLNGVVGTSAQGVASTDFQAGVQTVAALQALDENSRADKQIRLLEDKGNSYRFDLTSTAATDGDEVIRPDDVGSDSSAGRWIKIVGLGGDVVGPASSTDNSIARYSGTGGKTVQGSTVYVDDSGNLGVGTASPDSVIHAKTASSHCSITLERNEKGTGEVGLNLGGGTGGKTWYVVQQTNSDDLTFWDSNGDAARATFKSGGNVGIGTTSPDSALHVETATSHCSVTLERNAKGTGEVGVNLNGGTGGKFWYLVQQTNSDNLTFHDTDAARVTFEHGGNVGIGSTNPANALDVVGDVDITGNLTVGGTHTVVNTVTMNAANAIVFEGATADAHESTLTIIDPTGDRTIKLPNQSGCLPVLASDSATAITATPAELNYVDGVTSNIQTQLDSKGATAGSSSIVTTGALDSGSITSGFGTIDTGSSTITTTGLITGGSLDIDDVVINGSNIGHTNDTDLITVADGVVTVAGELDATSLDVSGDVDIDGTCEADAYTVNGQTLAAYITATAGGDITGVTAGTGLSGGGTSGAVTLNVDAAQTQITSVGTIGTGTWQGTAVASAYLDADTAHLSGTQTFSGAKTFSADATFDTDTVTFTSANSTDPLILIKNTTNDANGSRLRFLKDKGAAGADNDVLGILEFYGDDSGQNETAFATIKASISESADTDEAGKLEFFVAESDGTTTALTAGLTLEGEHATDGQIDVTIAAGAASTTTVAGDLSVTTDLTVNGDGTFHNSGSNCLISLEALGGANSAIEFRETNLYWQLGHRGSDNAFYLRDALSATGDVIQIEENAGDNLIYGKAGSLLGINTDAPTHTLTVAGTSLTTGDATFGVDDTGVDVRLFSATASEGVLYDASEDELALLLTTKLKFHDVGGGEEIYASSDGHLEVNAGTTLDMTAPTVDINASTAVTIDGPEITVLDSGNGTPDLVLKNTNADGLAASIKFQKDGASPANGDAIGSLLFFSEGAGNNQEVFCSVTADVADVSSGAEYGSLDFVMMTNGTAGTVLDINNTSAGVTTSSQKTVITGDTGGFMAEIINDGDHVSRKGLKVQCGVDDPSSSTNVYVLCNDGDGGASGQLQDASGTFSAADTSDRRLKKNIVDTAMAGLDTINAMQVRDFKWKKSGVKTTGFIAQEMQAAFPMAACGDEAGDAKTDPMMIMRDIMVIPLVKAVQELAAKVAELENN